MPMQPSPCAEATRPWVPSGRVEMGMSVSLREEFHEEAALDLVGGGGAGDGVDDLEALWLLEAGEFAVAMGADVIEGRGATASGPAGHDRAHDLTPFGMRHADHGYVVDARAGGEHRLDLRR